MIPVPATTDSARLPRRGRDGAQPANGAAAGFTLVELMVALALGAIISVVISIISSTARQAYTNTVSKVDVYNRFRLAFSTLKKDISGWIPTRELEFYIDGRGGKPADFQWQPGEQVPDRTDELGSGVIDGGVKGSYDEYAFIEQRRYESLEPDVLTFREAEGAKLHDAYHLYFKTMTFVDGAIREANVEYMLVDTSRPLDQWKDGVPPFPRDVKPGSVKDLALYKVVRYFDISSDTITQIVQYPIKRRVLELATNVTDFRVEYMVHNPFSQTARSEFRSPEEEYKKPVEQVTKPKLVRNGGTAGNAYRKCFGYGSMKLNEPYPRATAFSAKWGDQQLRNRPGHEPVRFGFFKDPKITFAELTAGDKIFIFTDTSIGAGGAAPQGGGAVNVVGQLGRFPQGEYTVKANLQGMLEFSEDVDSSTWGDKDQRPVNYKAAFLPSAVRITLRMVDDKGRNPKTMQQVVWLRRKAR